MTDSAPARGDRRALGLALGVALLIAFIRGFRTPNIWSATLQSVSLFDGFHRRFLVGTVLRPVVAVFGYHYAVFACFSFAVLVALLWLMIRAALRAPLWSQRALVLAFLLLPAGGFAFNEVGYFDQVLYLLLFASLALIARGRVIAAAAVIALTPMVHELAILTVVPVFGWFALRKVRPATAVVMTLPAAVIAGVVLMLPPVTPTAIPILETALATADFSYRIDALSLFERTQAQSWQLYHIRQQWAAVEATLAIAVLGYVALWWSDGQLWRAAARPLRAGMLAVSCLAIGAPALLIFGGWDDNRWILFLVANFLVVTWLSLGDGRRTELAPRSATVLLVAVLLFSQNQSYYFDLIRPRPLTVRTIKHLGYRLAVGREFEIPDN